MWSLPPLPRARSTCARADVLAASTTMQAEADLWKCELRRCGEAPPLLQVERAKAVLHNHERAGNPHGWQRHTHTQR